MGHLFISYSHKDTTYAHKLHQHLLEQGFEVWIDDRIDYGTEWPQEIKKRLKECNGFILLMSPSAEESFWVQNELNLALNLKKPIFPLLLDGENWWNLSTVQFVSVTGDKLPDAKFYVRLAEVLPPIWPARAAQPYQDEKTEGRPSEHPQAVLFPKKHPEKAWFQRTEIIAVIISLIVILIVVPIIILSWKELFPVDTHLPLEVTEKGTKMMLIPAGTFRMGSKNGTNDEKPVHQVRLDTFYMDIYEVTNALYKTCVDAGVCQPPFNSEYYDNAQYANHPVVYVNWYMAKMYCEWRGARLPTEAEWEYAARGTDDRSYPFGDHIERTYANYNGYGSTAVGNYESGKSPFGVYDLAGNVWEWVADWYDPNYYAVLGKKAINPQGPLDGQLRVMRGGSWGDYEDHQLVSNRDFDYPGIFNHYLGFRCVRSP